MLFSSFHTRQRSSGGEVAESRLIRQSSLQKLTKYKSVNMHIRPTDLREHIYVFNSNVTHENGFSHSGLDLTLDLTEADF